MSESQNRTLTEQFMLRLPDGMRDRIKAAAEANGRSMNSEIVATLEEKYPSRSADEMFFAAVHDLQGAITRLAHDPGNEEAKRHLKSLNDAISKVWCGLDRTEAEMLRDKHSSRDD